MEIMSVGRLVWEREMNLNKSLRIMPATLVATLFVLSSLNIGVEAVSAATGSQEVAMLGCLSQRMVRPSAYTLGCGSGTYVITDLHWTAWGGTNARGAGNYVLNTCTPTCAADDNVTYHATFVVHGVRSTSKGMVYGALTINYLRRGHRATVTWALPPF